MFIVFIVVLFVIFGGIHHSLKKNRHHIIHNDQWDYYQSLNQRQQTHFINEQIRMMNEMQQQMMNQMNNSGGSGML